MSRFAKIPIPLPKEVELKLAANKAEAKGPKGNISIDVPNGLSLKIEEGSAFLLNDEKAGVTSPFYGLYRALINNMVVGVSKGFEKRLNLIGVGYRAAVSGHTLDLQLGFSHPTKVQIPSNLKVDVEKSTTIIISGVDKQAVGQFAATVRSLRPPEPYKGKGVRYEDEYVRKKAGKAAKGG